MRLTEETVNLHHRINFKSNLMKYAQEENFQLNMRFEQFRYAKQFPSGKSLSRCSIQTKFNEIQFKKMPKYQRHMSMNIQGILRNNKRKKIRFFSDDSGNEISDADARKYLQECIDKGWKLIPCYDNCEGFDHFGGGCPGHLIEE